MIVPEWRQLPNSTRTCFPTWGSANRSFGMYLFYKSEENAVPLDITLNVPIEGTSKFGVFRM